mmetsp:Transcript_22851/g.49861  ORF Transcript_22851/g.49861 Transcript_22851/m.49861 type:complete len:586 (-) Transcript_22851:75-1832(-)|eukprot:CAMPEP_0168748720 /NCGR_PEP_ID=MMETSP0724-20121128/16322_1 /TAXON_ID=265536 /ORGANISM="Amphiprora sp., Strain CCMP467" /LENGTH=585 /DNA_ID=CAMNT_0008796559 /DNA_START=215 /DNA_END=1972 /DNA_ORIENTATION=-
MSVEVHHLPNNPRQEIEGKHSHHDHPGSCHLDDEKKEADLSITYAETEASFESGLNSTLVIRETSTEQVETSHIAFNTTRRDRSILNIAEEEDDDEFLANDEDHEQLEEISIIHHTDVSSFLLDEDIDTKEPPLISTAASSLVQDVGSTCQDSYTNALSCIPQTPLQCRNTWCEHPADSHHSSTGSDLAVKNTESGLFDYVDKLCFNKSGVNTATPLKDERDVAIVWDQYQRILEYDILELLGCANPPDAEELSKLWQNAWVPAPTTPAATDATNSPASKAPTRARRRQWQERAVRVHRLRTERQQQQRSDIEQARVPPSIPLMSRVRSMDDRLWSNRHHQSKESSSWPLNLFLENQSDRVDRSMFVASIPQHHEEEEGYDSDPEERVGSGTSTILQPRKDHLDANFWLKDSNIVDAVQESLNMTWSVTWHPPGKNEAPRSVTIWIERGTLIEFNTVMLEPNLMWRENFHPELETKRKLNASSQKPHSVRLLNLCRILSGVDSHRGVLVKPSHCVVVKTSDDQDYLFEANSAAQRDDMLRRWKLTTARFATLAVLEDLETICSEFFSPMITSRMLVPDYDASAAP